MVTRGKRITKLADVPLDTGLYDIDSEEKEAELIAKIKLLFKSNKISSKKVILGLSGLHCLTRPVTLPELPRAMMDEAITREAKRVLPVPLEQLYISWQAISTSMGKIEAFMVAIPKQTADTLIRILTKAGFKPYLMDIKPLALARLAREDTAIIVDVQSTEFDIVVVVNRIPQPIRTVPFPEEESLSLAEKIPIVKDELKRTLQFYNSNNPDSPLSPNVSLLVSGELADEPELYESLAEELGYQVSPLTSPLKCVKQLDPSMHLVNVGLALKENTQEAGPLLPNFNTLPTPYLPIPISLNRIMAIPAAVVAVGLILLLALTVQGSAANIESIRNQLDSNSDLLQKKQEQKAELTSSITEAEQKVASIESARKNFTAALSSIATHGDKINADLEAIVDNQVDNFELNNVSHTGTLMTLIGMADSEQEVLEYVRKLYATGRYSEITISYLLREGGSSNTSTMGYTLSIKWNK
jgi:type IV pilus assembly protein PilM